MVAISKMKAHEAYKEWKSDPSVSRTLSLNRPEVYFVIRDSLQYVPQMRKLFEANNLLICTTESVRLVRPGEGLHNAVHD